MHWGKRGPGSLSRRRREDYRPSTEPLEGRRLLAAFDLTTTQTAPLGVEFVGKAANNTAGYTVTDVGNVTGSGYDSFVVSAPGFAASTAGGTPNFSTAGESAAYLVFGSKQVNVGNAASFLNLTKGTTNGTTSTLTGGQRAGDLGELGTLGVAAQSGITGPTAQTNPTVAQPQPSQASTHVYGFNFDGLTLVTGLDTTTGLGRNSALGFSVAPLGDINGDGYDDFAISAPNDAGGGRVFVIYGGPALATQTTANKTIDLEATAGTTTTSAPTKVVSLSLPTTGTTGTDVGYSVAGLGNYFNTSSSSRDLAIGVPGLTVNGAADEGAVFAISGNYLNTQSSGANVDLSTIGLTTNTTGGIEYTGTTAGALTGFSVSTAGDFDGATGNGGRAVNDLLIGAPHASIGGAAYLVYGVQPYLPNQTLGSTLSLSTVGTLPVTTPSQTYPLQGIVFFDTAAGDELGFSVATAGSFNGSGVNSIVLGAPGYLTNTGYADIIYGQAGTNAINPTTTGSRLIAQVPISPLSTTTTVKSTSLVGPGINDFVGFSLAVSGHINFTGQTATTANTDVLIGAPGLQTAYDVSGTASGGTALTGPQQLSTIGTAPLNGNTFVVSGTADPSLATGAFGTSVSARNPIVDPNTGSNTVDGDSVPDLFFGAPFSSLSNPVNPATIERQFAGVAYLVEGGLVGTSSSGSGGSTGGGSGSSSTTGSSAIPNAFSILTPLIFTGTDFGLVSPPVTELSHLTSYQPLPVQLAFQQFRTQPGFLARENVYHHPSQAGTLHQAPAGTILNVAAIGHSENKYSKKNTLPKSVFTRGGTLSRPGQQVTFTHKVKVIPSSEQTETFNS